MNTQYFHDLVRGCYGRKIAYTNVDTITANNVVKVIGSTIGIFNWNKPVIKYLWDYYKGDQPILYRHKLTNEVFKLASSGPFLAKASASS